MSSFDMDSLSVPSAAKTGRAIGGKVGETVASAPSNIAGGVLTGADKWYDFALFWAPIYLLLSTSLVTGGWTLFGILAYLYLIGEGE